MSRLLEGNGPLAWVWERLRTPGHLPQGLINSLCRLAFRRDGRPGRLSFGLADRLYRYKRPLAREEQAFASATASLNRLSAGAALAPAAGKALVFLLRGPAYGHNLHNYLIAGELRRLGYDVSFVVCNGSVERCGYNQEKQEFFAPPFLCHACRAITRKISADGFGVVSLNDYACPDEHQQVEASLADPAILETLRPFLMRFFHGDYRKIQPDDPEVLNHQRAAVRYLLRYRNLLDQLRPSCVCLFNGLFFPDSLFLKEARARGVPALVVERGARKNTLFVARDEPACHYRCDAAWEQVEPTLTAEHARIAGDYLASRMRGPEDPSGIRRDLAGADESRYRELAQTPYAVLFAPVTHDTVCMEKQDPAGGFFASLDLLAAQAVRSKKRLIVRCHPDEHSPQNPSHYPIRKYMQEHGLLHPEYVVCLDSREKWNPYLLAKYADAIVIYNGTLGIELPALGYDVFNIAVSHYSGKGFTLDLAECADFARIFETVKRQTDAVRERALRYLYYYVFVANLPIDQLLDEYEPFFFNVVSGDPPKQTEQLGLIRERLALLLGVQARVEGTA